MGIKEEIFAADDLACEPYAIEEWGVTVKLQGFTAGQRAKLMHQVLAGNSDPALIDWATVYPEIVIAGTYDPETGQPLFTKDDSDALNKKSGLVIERLAIQIMKLSGVDPEAVAELEKN